MDAIFSYSDIVTINFKGIYCKNERDECHILFEECRKNFAFENSLKNSKCVATRNIEKGEFTFFTTPKIKIVFKNKKDFYLNRLVMLMIFMLYKIKFSFWVLQLTI